MRSVFVINENSDGWMNNLLTIVKDDFAKQFIASG